MGVHLCVNVYVFVYVRAGDECMHVCMQVFMSANVHICTYMLYVKVRTIVFLFECVCVNECVGE